jgi:hypothetical protein
MGIRTPDLLHAIQRQPVHSCPSLQVTVPASTQQSTGIQTRCGTSLLYGPMPPTAVKQCRVVLGPTPCDPLLSRPDFTHLPRSGWGCNGVDEAFAASVGNGVAE